MNWTVWTENTGNNPYPSSWTSIPIANGRVTSSLSQEICVPSGTDILIQFNDIRKITTLTNGCSIASIKNCDIRSLSQLKIKHALVISQISDNSNKIDQAFYNIDTLSYLTK